MANSASQPRNRDTLFTVICLLTFFLSVIMSVVGPMANLGVDSSVVSLVKPSDNEFMPLIAGFVSGLVLLLLLIVGYFLSFRVSAAGRPVARLYLLFLSLSQFPTTLAISANTEEFLFWLISIPALLFPVFLLLLERLFGSALIALGRFCYGREWWEMAATLLRQGLCFCANSRMARRDYGMALREMGDITNARRYLEPLFEEEGVNDEALVHTLSDLALRDKDWKAAAPRLEALRARRPDDLGTLYQLALAKSNLKEFAAARDLLESVPEDKQTPAMLELLDAACLETKDLPGALRIVERLRKTLSYEETARRYESLSRVFSYEPLIPATAAKVAQERKKPTEEARWLERLLDLTPEDWTARRRLVSLYQEQSRPDLELGHLEFLVKRQGDPNADLIIDYARALGDDGRAADAVAQITRHIDRFPADYRFPLALARHDLREGRLVTADRHARRALELAPKESTPIPQALLIEIEKAAIARELDKTRKAAEADPGDIELRLAYIVKLIASDQAEESVAELDRLVTRHPQLKPRVQREIMEHIGSTERPFLILSYLSDLALQDHDFERALTLYESMSQRSLRPEEIVGEGCRRILKVQPDYLPARATLGQFHASRNEWERVVEVMKPYFKSGGEHTVEADTMMFEASCRLGDLEQAIIFADRMAAHRPRDTRPLQALAALYEQNRFYKEAVATLRRAQGIDGGDPAMARRLQDLEAKIRETRFAELKHLLEADPQNRRNNYEIGLIYMDRKEYMPAIKHLQVASYEPALANIAGVRLALCMARRQLLDLAVEQIKNVVLDPVGDPDVDDIKRTLYEVATIYEQKDNRAEALDIYKRIFRADAGYRDVAMKLEALS